MKYPRVAALLTVCFAAPVLLGVAILPSRATEPLRLRLEIKVSSTQNDGGEIQEPDSPDLRKRQAKILTRLAADQYVLDGNAAVAKAGFVAAQKLDPEYALPLFNLGALAERQQTWKEAASLYRRYIQMEKSTEGQQRAALRLAAVQQHLQTAANAVPAKTDNAANTAKDAYMTQIMQALAAAQKGGTPEASALAARTIQTAPQRWEGYVAQSSVLLKQNRYQEAEQSLQEARNRAPTSRSQALQEAITACHAAGQAQEHCTAAARALREGKPAEAAASYEQAARLLPTNGNLAVAAAGARAAAGDYAQALRNLEAPAKSPDRAIAARAAKMRQNLSELAAQKPGAGQGEKSPMPATPRLNRTLEQLMAQVDSREQDVSAAVTQAIQTGSLQADERAKLARELAQALAEAQAAGKAAAQFDAEARQRDDGTNSGKLAASVAQLNGNKQRTKQKKTLERAAMLREKARAYGYGEPGYTP